MCASRATSALVADGAGVASFIDELERELIEGEAKEVDSKEIGERVMRLLREVDEVAYVRFASVYRSFRDIEAGFGAPDRAREDGPHPPPRRFEMTAPSGQPVNRRGCGRPGAPGGGARARSTSWPRALAEGRRGLGALQPQLPSVGAAVVRDGEAHLPSATPMTVGRDCTRRSWPCALAGPRARGADLYEHPRALQPSSGPHAAVHRRRAGRQGGARRHRAPATPNPHVTGGGVE